MSLKIRFAFLAMVFSWHCYSQDYAIAIDSIKKIVAARYEALGKAMDERDLEKILSFKTPDFHSIGPDGKVQDHITMKEYSRQYITNNIPPYNSKFTILNLRISANSIVAVVDVQQETTRKKELVGKVREIYLSVIQTETWIQTEGEWKLKLVDNVRDQKRYVDGKRVDPTKPYNPDDPPFNPETKKGN